jgi:predicted phage terminase large subunit-like protein
VTTEIKRATREEIEEYEKLLVRAESFSLARSLSQFIRAAWHVIEPGTDYLHNWHIDAVSEHLQAVSDGQITRLIINIPPRYMKSITVTIMYPVWEWTRNAAERFLFTSFSDTLVKDHSLKRRAILESEWYQRRWGSKVQLAADQNEKKEYQNTAKGHMISFPIGGSITGKGGTKIIIDDPQDPEAADSQVEREHAIRFIDSTLSTRLDDKKRGSMIVVMQRLHQKDVTGHLMAKGDWQLLKIPAEAERKMIMILPISKRKITREIGDILWNEREGEKELTRQKIAMTPARYAGQYQQEPAPESGTLFKRDWWKYYTSADVPKEFDYVLDSWDCTFKDGEQNDFVVGGKWGVKGANIYLLRLVRQRMDFTETAPAVLNMAKIAPIGNAKLIEDKANGTAIIQTLRKVVPGILAVEPMGSKWARASAAAPTVKAGNVFLPDPNEDGMQEARAWVREYIEELAVFDKGDFDDQVDMTSQAINHIVLRAGGFRSWLDKKIAEDEEAVKKAKEQNRHHIIERAGD